MKNRIWNLTLIIILLVSGCTSIDQPLEPEFQPTTSLLPVPTNTPTVMVTQTPLANLEVHYGDVRTPTRVDQMVADLKDLPIEEFFEKSFQFWLSRDPEKITILGLSQRFNMRDNRLTDISEEYLLETDRLEREILTLLQMYDREVLTIDDQLNYDIYEWFWQDRINAQAYRNYDYLVHSYPYTSMNTRLVDLFVLHQPLENRQDIEDFISRLYQVKPKIDQLIDLMLERADEGIIPPRIVLSDAINQTKDYLQLISPVRYQPEQIIIYQVFSEKISKIETITPEQKKVYLRQVLDVLQTSFIPAYQELADTLSTMMELSNDDIGIWTYDDGQAYYQYLLQHYTSSDVTPEQIYMLGELQLETVSSNLLAAADQMNGDSIEAEIPEIVLQYQNRAGVFSYQNDDYEDLLYLEWKKIYQNTSRNIHELFPTDPRFSFGTQSNEMKLDLFSPPFINDPWFEILMKASWNDYSIPRAALRTMLYAEVYPGMQYQQILSASQDQPLFRQVITFPGYSEGWSLYAPFVLSQNHAYRSDPYGEMYRIHREIFFSASLVVDSGIHNRGWSYGESANFLEDSTGMVRGSMRQYIDRYIVIPGQIASYSVGFQQFTNLRNYARDNLGGNFDELAYHTWLLEQGNMPLEILNRQVEDYVIQQRKLNNRSEIP